LSADGGNDLGEAPGWILLRALEHQMFEEMGEARLARRLIGGADLVPDHVGHDRRATIGNDHDLEPVREGEVGDLRADAGMRRTGEQRAGKGGDGKD
jgi:hypothetical protein